MSVLLTLHVADNRMDFAAVSQKLGIRKQNLDNAMGVLERYKFAQRFLQQYDARKRWLEITPAGRAFVKQLCEAA